MSKEVNLDGTLECVECGAPLESNTCTNCGRHFSLCRGAPVMMRNDNALFPPDAYQVEEGGRPAHTGRGLKARIKKSLPRRSVNVARQDNLSRIARTHGNDTARILVIGCGHQKQEMLSYFEGTGAQLIFCDIDKAADVDLYCDSHRLPFRDGVLTGIITTAVLEHVLKPWVVAEEIHRVLAPRGFVYSEVPFLQAVHEGPFDFTRFSLGGHRLLFEKFDEQDSGVVAGPGTTLTWALVEYARALPRNKKLSSVFRLGTQALFFWLKYTDHALGQARRAQESASCTFFYGLRRETAVSPLEIIQRYGQTDFTHT